MDKQEIFDKVWLGLKKQNWAKSVNINGDCVYRGKGGTCCAIGLLIPDELYDPMIEGIGIHDITSYGGKGSLKLKSILNHLGLLGESSFLFELQDEHDCGNSGKYLKNSLTELAKGYNLKIPNQ